MRNLPPALKHIIIINVLMFVATLLIGDRMYEIFALFPIGSPWFQVWQPITNMYTLFFFGMALERTWGSKKFVIYYFVTGLGAAACHLAVMYLQGAPLNIPTVGASGAVYGVLLAYGMLYPNSRITMVFPIPVTLKAKWFGVIFGAIELVTGIFDTTSGIAHFAHLGGMIFGFFLILWWKKRNRLYTWE